MVDAKMWVHDSTIHDIGVAEELFDNVLPPIDRKELGTTPMRRLLDEAVLNSVRVSPVTRFPSFPKICLC